MIRRPAAWGSFWRTSSANRNVAIFLVLYGALSAWMEWRARGDAQAFCTAQAPGRSIAVDAESLLAWQRAAKQVHGSLHVIDWRPDAPPAPAGDGALVTTFLGFFPFGRESCMIRLEGGRVARKRVVLGSDDHEYCGGDMRLITECPSPAR